MALVRIWFADCDHHPMFRAYGNIGKRKDTIHLRLPPLLAETYEQSIVDHATIAQRLTNLPNKTDAIR